MAKELPYFKFEPSEWDNGNIQMCSRESKGLFIELCSIYWTRLGELPYALALQKLCNGNKDAMQELIKHNIIGIINEQIIIEFLDEQLSEFSETSEKRRIAANKRWNDASALHVDSKSNAIREDNIREEKKKQEETKQKIALSGIFLLEGVQSAWLEWESYKKEKKQKLTPSTAKKQMAFLGGRAGPEAIAIINQSITNGWTGLFELKTHQPNGNQTSITAKGTLDRLNSYTD
jgi:hypothetical protein